MQYDWRDDPRWAAAHTAAVQDTRRGSVFCYQSGHDPWFSSSYYFETERGVVLIDTEYFQTSAAELWENIRRETSGQLLVIVITHAHPDHHWGNTFFHRVAPRAPILTSAGVFAEIEGTYVRQAEGIPEGFRPDCLSDPADIVLPDTVFHDRLTMRFDEITLELWECGPAECLHQVAGWIPEQRVLVAGDVLSNRQTVDAAQQTVEAWQLVLRGFTRLGPEHVLTGHLGAAGPELLAELDAWFSDLLALTGHELGPGEDPGRFAALDTRARAGVVAAMRERHPDWWDAMMSEADESILEWGLRMAAEREGTAGGTVVRRAPVVSAPCDLVIA
jgi:glyoxylase-like metal-dependent hydrolase (beta-lactamase superfamily II)